MPAAAPPVLELRGIHKRFGPVHANRGVDLRVEAGSIHGLIGENGAGKSTLMNIVFGFYEPDAGEIRVGGVPAVIRRPADAIAAGIGMVHQHFMLVENFTVLENIVLGAEGGARLAGGLAQARTALEALARDYGLEAPLDEPVENLPVGVQQRVEILKALYRGARLLILDEPTAVLTPREADQLFRMLARLRQEGKTVILVTHKLREIMAVTDRVTVMRQGAVAGEVATAETSPAKLAELMVGRAVALRVEKSPARPSAVLLSVRGLEVRDRWGIRRLRSASFDLRAGEIVAVAGVAGNGQSELLAALAGLAQPSAGRIVLKGRDLVALRASPKARRRWGLAHVPEDRLRDGVVARFSAEDNAILGYQDSPDYARAGFLRRGEIRSACRRKMIAWDVRPPQPERRFGVFSGGNQQKLVLAREIDANPEVLIVGQPTRGVDIGAIEFIHRRLVALRDAGKALLIVSVELDEVLGLADRILVMAGGEIVGELDRAQATEERIGLLMAGIREEDLRMTARRALVENALLPCCNLAAALLVSALIIRIIGENPGHALKLLVAGAFGSGEGLGYTLYYATNFMFTGLSVAVAYHAGLFNIGAEGQAYIGGLCTGLVCLHAGRAPLALVLPLAILAGAAGGAAWAFLPGWLQARRGSHIVITTIMFNFLASALMTFLLVNVLIQPGQQSPESREFAHGAWMPTAQAMLGLKGSLGPLNLAFPLALLAGAGVWALLWRTRWGYSLRVAGESPAAARYGGISPEGVIIATMLLSGALAGGLGLNELMGAQHRISLDFPAGAGFVGIAVALMGRNHPLGILLAAILFGALMQGGSELSFDMPHVNRDMVVVIQGLVILFCGALENIFRRPLRALWKPTSE